MAAGLNSRPKKTLDQETQPSFLLIYWPQLPDEQLGLIRLSLARILGHYFDNFHKSPQHPAVPDRPISWKTLSSPSMTFAAALCE
ncbi:hypothetical protein ACFC5Z_32980 [Streptomyces sp. NPDC056004]|uniref:hypothetical protein n=1 Tax=Streptomyces sp. NPDC056004 TaxID=3345677 RepID=UPI0035DAF1A2